jgi:cobalt/nickel transport system ATP-binding protein
MELMIRLEDISFAYPGSPKILDGLDFELHQGDRIGLLGHNGSGKTTMFHIIMGLLKPDSGKIEIFGKPAVSEKDFTLVRQRIGLLFQDADDQLFCPTVLEDVAFGPLNLGKSEEEAVEIARKTLDRLGLSGFENRITCKLSGGEKRLAALATVLAMEPSVLLLDEPSAGLDRNTKEKLVAVLSELDLSYILISHESDFLSDIATTIYAMEDGKILTDKELHLHRHIHAHPLGTHPHSHKP